MKICLIDPDYEYAKVFKDFMFGHAHVTHVPNAREFGFLDLNFDCILVEYMLPDTCGEWLVQAIKEKSKAKLALISVYEEHITPKNVRDPAISGLFRKNKYDHENIIAWVERIKKEQELLKILEEMVVQEVS